METNPIYSERPDFQDTHHGTSKGHGEAHGLSLTENAPHLAPRLETEASAEALAKASRAARLAQEKHGLEVTVFDVGAVSMVTDFVVIASGNSGPQVRAMADAVKEGMKQYELFGFEQDKGPRWVLLDYGDVIVHLMHTEQRDFYQLEQFWSRAYPVPEDKWTHA